MLTTIFFDLDDTLYPASSGLWMEIKERMNVYMRERMGFPPEQIPYLREKYFREYGTTLRGLMAYHQVDEADFLAFVHDLPLDRYLSPDPGLRAMIESLPTRNLVFTNADSGHAGRVIAALGLDGVFASIVDVVAVAPYCKPNPEAFGIAMRLAGESDPSRCLMIDDQLRTVKAARDLGMLSLLIADRPSDEADFTLSRLHDLPFVLNGRLLDPRVRRT
ncbi:MAG: pyrimidine 5'-nucleotidase [Chloroflexota bacterium]